MDTVVIIPKKDVDALQNDKEDEVIQKKLRRFNKLVMSAQKSGKTKFVFKIRDMNQYSQRRLSETIHNAGYFISLHSLSTKESAVYFRHADYLFYGLLEWCIFTIFALLYGGICVSGILGNTNLAFVLLWAMMTWVIISIVIIEQVEHSFEL
jgi:hypothetical protein